MRMYELNQEAVEHAHRIMIFLMEKRLSLCVVAEISRINLSDLRNVFRFLKPRFCKIRDILHVLLLFKELIAKYERDNIKQDIYHYLADYFQRNPLPLGESPNNFEPVDYSQKHGGDTCKIY